MNRKMIDITGLRSGRTVALSPRRRKDGRLDWKCLCDYGTTHDNPLAISALSLLITIYMFIALVSGYWRRALLIVGVELLGLVTIDLLWGLPSWV